MKNKWFVYNKWVAFCIGCTSLAACASRQAALNAADSRKELTSYVQDVNTRIAEDEQARLKLEYVILGVDIKNQLASGKDAEQVALDAVALTKRLIAKRDQRLALFLSATAKAIKADTLMGSVQGYNATGVTLDNVQSVLLQVAGILNSTSAMPTTPTVGKE